MVVTLRIISKPSSLKKKQTSFAHRSIYHGWKSHGIFHNLLTFLLNHYTLYFSQSNTSICLSNFNQQLNQISRLWRKKQIQSPDTLKIIFNLVKFSAWKFGKCHGGMMYFAENLGPIYHWKLWWRNIDNFFKVTTHKLAKVVFFLFEKNPPA